MGGFRIVIEGVGQHHSDPQSGQDADKIANDTAATLEALGHEVSSARLELLAEDGSIVRSQDLLTGAWSEAPAGEASGEATGGDTGESLDEHLAPVDRGDGSSDEQPAATGSRA